MHADAQRGQLWVAMTGPGRGRRHHSRHWGGGTGWGGPEGRGPRARRGDVRAAILALLDEEPRNGYQVIQEIEERTQGVWKPSPGSVYPALQVLVDEGLVREADADGKRTFALTDEGRAHVAEHRDRIGKPWEDVTSDIPVHALELREQVRELMHTVRELGRAGTPEQAEKAKAVLADARKAIYRILGGE